MRHPLLMEQTVRMCQYVCQNQLHSFHLIKISVVSFRLQVWSDEQPMRVRGPPGAEPHVLRLLPGVRQQRGVGEAVPGGRRRRQALVRRGSPGG